MNSEGLKIILSATPNQIQMLERKLQPGDAYPFQMNLGTRFRPSSLPAWLRPIDEGYQLRLEQSVDYAGDDDELEAFAESGSHNTETLDELVRFMRRNFGSTTPRTPQRPEREATSRSRIPDRVTDERGEQQPEPRSPLVPAAHVTDLPEARRALAAQAAPRRLLIDADKLAARIKATIHGQDAAIDVLAKQIANEFAKIERTRPLSFFFLGPTGIGKTQTALALADALSFPNDGVSYQLVRHNMNEYQERHSAYRFVGAPPSYVGYGDPPQLFRDIENNPYLVLLFDEIEKAHPDILHTLMNLIDTGELVFPGVGGTNVRGDFRRCVLVFTSNLRLPAATAADALADQASVEFQVRTRQQLVREKMPPEIAGRIQTFLRFRELSAEDLLAIVADQIQRCASAYGLTVNRIAPQLLAQLAQHAATSHFGVRIVAQAIEQQVAPELVQALRENSGLKHVEITFADDEIVVLPHIPSAIAASTSQS